MCKPSFKAGTRSGFHSKSSHMVLVVCGGRGREYIRLDQLRLDATKQVGEKKRKKKEDVAVA